MFVAPWITVLSQHTLFTMGVIYNLMLICFQACSLPGWAKDLSAPRYKQCMRTVLLTYLFLFAIQNSKFVLFLLLMCDE